MRRLKLALLYAARFLGLFGLARRLTFHRIRIVCYHGGSLGDEHLFNPLLFCTADHLERRLRWLNETGFSFVSLQRAVDMLLGKCARARLPVVVTFDDGWFSTFRVLAPVIAHYRVPAVLYLCTGYFASGQPVPDVSLSYLFWKAGPKHIKLQGLDPNIDGEYALAVDSVRMGLWQRTLSWLQERPPLITQRLIALATQLGLDEEAFDLASRRFGFVDAHEIKRMRAAGWCIELHGHRHLYPRGQPDALRQDIDACQEEIARLGLQKGVHYCYPGGEHDRDAHHLLASLGVASATTCVPGLAPEGEVASLYYLPRFLDGDKIHLLEFEAEMSGFSDGLRALIATFGSRRASLPG